MNLLKELLDLGYGHVISGLAAVIVALWLRFELANRRQNRTREAWHAATQCRVDAMQVHVDECNDDREILKKQQADLRVKVATLTVRTERMASCPLSECPNRPR